MKKYICLRDDDTNFYTKYNELLEGYGEFFGKIPITLATVPFSHGSQQKILEFEYPSNKKFERLRDWEKSASSDELSEYHKIRPIGENQDLVNKLKPLIKHGMIEIAQHGVSHRYNEYGAEMFYDNVGLLQIRDGKEYLSKVFETDIKVFIPPSNSIDTRCAKYLQKIGLDILSCGSLKYRNKKQKIADLLCNPIDIINSIKNRLLGIKRIPPIYCKRGVTITASLTFNAWNDIDDILRRVMDLLEKNNAVSVTTHYMLLNNESDSYKYRNKYQLFLSKLLSIKDVEFVTASKYIQWLKTTFKVV